MWRQGQAIAIRLLLTPWPANVLLRRLEEANILQCEEMSINDCLFCRQATEATRKLTAVAWWTRTKAYWAFVNYLAEGKV